MVEPEIAGTLLSRGAFEGRMIRSSVEFLLRSGLIAWPHFRYDAKHGRSKEA
jgi:hypothetical protein